MGKIRRVINDEVKWFDTETGDPCDEPENRLESWDSGSSNVIQDTFKKALRHPVTGEMVDSHIKWNAINKAHGLECVGNDLLSKQKPRVKDKITDELILDRMAKAESIINDPSKYRAYQNEQIERREKHFEKIGRTAFGVQERIKH